jgi:hypothetical protein
MADITQRKRGGGHGDPALGSMAGLHRAKEGLFLTSVAMGRSAGVGEKMVNVVKRKAAVLVGEAEKRRSVEEGDARRRAGPASSSRTLRLHSDGASAFWYPAPLPPLLHSTDISGGGIGEESPSG